MSLQQPVAIVTGSSRGAGRGIAKALGSHGCIVYVTGRSQTDQDADVPGTIYATAEEVTQAGGKGIAVRCDSDDDAQIKALIDQVIAEQGRIDILVNNACYQSYAIAAPGQFWEKPIEIGEMITVGLRSGFITSWYAAPHMARQGSGLVVFTSSPGSMHYCFGPAYGAQKAGSDKMAFDMGVDFADAGLDVAAISVWMGSLSTERLLTMMAAMPELQERLEGTLESPEYTGEVVWAIYNDPEKMKKFNGKTIIGAEVGQDYGIKDIGGKFPPSVRDGTGAVPPEYYPYKVK
jgi:NAD(P)-dependent dehydrogenase (short-subunit alcohol dehydrogenase family)